METETVINDGVIAKFMGLRHRKAFGPISGEEFIEVKQTPNANWQITYYSTSWDWLMPVVEKIETVEANGQSEFSVDTARKHCIISSMVRKTGTRKHITFQGIGETKLEAVYQAVLEFIKWYNNQKENGNRNS